MHELAPHNASHNSKSAWKLNRRNRVGNRVAPQNTGAEIASLEACQLPENPLLALS